MTDSGPLFWILFFFFLHSPPNKNTCKFFLLKKKKINSILTPACPSLPLQTPLDDFKQFLELLFSSSLEDFLTSCILSFACTGNLSQITSCYSNLGPYSPLCGHLATFCTFAALFPETFALLGSFVSSAGAHLPPVIIHLLSWGFSFHYAPGVQWAVTSAFYFPPPPVLGNCTHKHQFCCCWCIEVSIEITWLVVTLLLIYKFKSQLLSVIFTYW